MDDSVPIRLSKAPIAKDSEKQQLRYKAEKLQKEFRNARLREMKAIETAHILQELLTKQIECNKNLKKSLCEKEIEIVQMREVVDELNGALQRANMAEQHRKSNRGLSDKLADNLETIHTSINDKKSLISLIEQQKEELSQYSKIIRAMVRALKDNDNKPNGVDEQQTSPQYQAKDKVRESTHDFESFQASHLASPHSDHKDFPI